MLKHIAAILLSAVILVLGSGTAALAESIEQEQQILNMVADYSDRICNIVQARGSSQSITAKGDIKAELNGLAKKLANLGVTGAADITTSEYEGVLQTDLAKAIADNAACKRGVQDKLVDKLLRPPEQRQNYNFVKDRALADYIEKIPAIPVMGFPDLASGDHLSPTPGGQYGELIRAATRHDCYPSLPRSEWQPFRGPAPMSLGSSDLDGVLGEGRHLADTATATGFRSDFLTVFDFEDMQADETPSSTLLQPAQSNAGACAVGCTSGLTVVETALRGKEELRLTFYRRRQNADVGDIVEQIEGMAGGNVDAKPAPKGSRSVVLTLRNSDSEPIAYKPLYLCNLRSAETIAQKNGNAISGAVHSSSEMAEIQRALASNSELMATLAFPPVETSSSTPERFDQIPLERLQRYLRYKGDLALAAQLIKQTWPMPTGNYADYRYSDLDQITADNVAKLQPVWMFSTGVLRGHEGGPLVVGNLMYVHTPFPNMVFALDLSHDSRILWKYMPTQEAAEVLPRAEFDSVNRGTAYSDHKIILDQANAIVVALDEKLGKPIWTTPLGDPSKGETMVGAPMVVRGKVLVGIGGGDFGVRGRITALDLGTGKLLWQAYSVGPDAAIEFDANTTSLGKRVGPNSSRLSWEGDQWQLGGGTTSGWLSYDPQLNLIYYGSGNPGVWNPLQRPGDNKWSDTIFARNPDTGIARWVYQLTPHDEWHYDGSNEMILADIPVNGKMTKALVHFDSNGFAYILDREAGTLLLASKFMRSTNWASRVDLATGRPEVVRKYSPEAQGQDHYTKDICPGAQGAKGPQPASFSPATGLFYVPVNRLCMDYRVFRVTYTPGMPYIGATVAMRLPDNQKDGGDVIAWSADNGKIVWEIGERFPVWSGVLTTRGNLVFYGTLDGYLKALDANTGKVLYRFKTPSGVIGNVTAYEYGGKEYIAVLSGIGGWPGVGLVSGLTEDTAGLGAVGAYKALSDYTQLGGVVTVFGLRD
jgi:lanthanide-dependent methanol dehydrogenase